MWVTIIKLLLVLFELMLKTSSYQTKVYGPNPAHHLFLYSFMGTQERPFSYALPEATFMLHNHVVATDCMGCLKNLSTSPL